MDPRKTVTEAVRDAQEVLADYVEPGPRDCEQTVNKLLDILDDEQVVEALEDEEHGQQGYQRAGRPAAHKHS